MPYEQLAQWAFDLPGGRQRYSTRLFPAGEQDHWRLRLPVDAENINLIVEHPVSAQRERELNPAAFAQCDAKGDITQAGKRELASIRDQAIAEEVQSGSAYEAKLTCLAHGRQGSMSLRELEPLRAAAEVWSRSADEQAIGNCKQEAARIMQAKFAGVCSVQDLLSAISGKQKFSEYDDSDSALGRQAFGEDF
jgi:hypothetical protein